jgi:hypothetical protein
MILRDPDGFPADQGPPAGFHRLLFRNAVPFTEPELRKLSPSADFYGSLIGVMHDKGKGPLIWGIIHSGLRWAQSIYGGGKIFQPLPGSLVIHVTNPGRITVNNGSIEIATLNSGEIICPATGVFDSKWVSSEFASTMNEEFEFHMEARRRSTKPWANIGPEFFRRMLRQIFVRIISRIRYKRHGGTLICIPDSGKDEFVSSNPYIKFKYGFFDEEPRRRFSTLIVQIANSLAESYGSSAKPEGVVGWREYLTSKDQSLSRLDEAVFELAHFVSDMAQVDGAVVMTRRLELIGFGAEISGKIERVDTIAQALDPEGFQTRLDQNNHEGTRHHTAYSLCNVLHDVLVVVISQDGTAQVVKWKDGMVMVWDLVSPGLIYA